MRVLDTDNSHVLAYARGDIVVLANFSETPQNVHVFDVHLPQSVRDLVRDQPIQTESGLALEPYQFVWLTPLSAG